MKFALKVKSIGVCLNKNLRVRFLQDELIMYVNLTLLFKPVVML